MKRPPSPSSPPPPLSAEHKMVLCSSVTLSPPVNIPYLCVNGSEYFFHVAQFVQCSALLHFSALLTIILIFFFLLHPNILMRNHPKKQLLAMVSLDGFLYALFVPVCTTSASRTNKHTTLINKEDTLYLCAGFCLILHCHFEAILREIIIHQTQQLNRMSCE